MTKSDEENKEVHVKQYNFQKRGFNCLWEYLYIVIYCYAIYMGKIYTVREACDILQMDATTLRRWDREGKIHCIRLSNNFRRVPKKEIDRILGIKNNRVDAVYAR
ncbi:helix-turn-helix domain-containing protein, partial [Thermoplasma sp. Kam2015]|uniref:MerR family transcriptional regulator n=1 Tax=Thermoplasma sp. Kam2015 TaxID=2094122 RepID=UPI0012936BFE